MGSLMLPEMSRTKHGRVDSMGKSKKRAWGFGEAAHGLDAGLPRGVLLGGGREELLGLLTGDARERRESRDPHAHVGIARELLGRRERRLRIDLPAVERDRLAHVGRRVVRELR